MFVEMVILSLKIQVYVYQIQYAVYSFPEIFWKLPQSESDDTWSYIVLLRDILLPRGKFNARELTEEEIKEMENKKTLFPKQIKKI